jgi:hypothetical protein
MHTSRQRVQLDERPLVEQGVDAFARGELALGVHLVHRGFADRVQRLLGALAQFGELARGGVDVDVVVGLRLDMAVDVSLGSARHGCRS